MTDLTIRQILDAMTRALDTTARRFASQSRSENAQPRQELEDSADQKFEGRRPG
jgi:hypothetical protein